MIIQKQILRALTLAAAAWAIGSGAQAARPAPPMSLGLVVQPPAGYVAFCGRRPADCRVPSAQTQAVTRADVEPSGVVGKINTQVNHAIFGVRDSADYGVAEYWTTPLEEGRNTGDCEDYVLEKIRALTAAGVPRAALNIAAVTTASGEAHAVLLVTTGAGDYVLDNRTNVILRWNETGYQWDARQVGGQAFAWRQIEKAAR